MPDPEPLAAVLGESCPGPRPPSRPPPLSRTDERRQRTTRRTACLPRWMRVWSMRMRTVTGWRRGRAEFLRTFWGSWRYPDQLRACSAVHVSKRSSWSPLVIMMFTIVANLKHIEARIHVPDAWDCAGGLGLKQGAAGRPRQLHRRDFEQGDTGQSDCDRQGAQHQHHTDANAARTHFLLGETGETKSWVGIHGSPFMHDE